MTFILFRSQCLNLTFPQFWVMCCRRNPVRLSLVPGIGLDICPCRTPSCRTPNFGHLIMLSGELLPGRGGLAFGPKCVVRLTHGRGRSLLAPPLDPAIFATSRPNPVESHAHGWPPWPGAAGRHLVATVSKWERLEGLRDCDLDPVVKPGW